MSNVSIVKCKDYDNKRVEDAVRKSLDLIGGMQKIVKKGDKVLLKVNLTTIQPPERGVTTHPAVVRAVAKIVQEYGGDVTVGDSTDGYNWKMWRKVRGLTHNKFKHMCFADVNDFYKRLKIIENPREILELRFPGTDKPVFTPEEIGFDQINEEIYARLEYEDFADELGVKLVMFDECDWVHEKNPAGSFLKCVWIATVLRDADVIIDMPKLKTHDIMLYTGAIKNCLGCAPGQHKSRYHMVAFSTGNMGEMLVDIFGLVKPKLSIMDGIVGMEENGPLRGPLRQIGIISSGFDSVALDAVCSSVINYDPMEIHTTRIAASRGLGIADLKNISVLGEKIDKVRIKDFKRPSREAGHPWLH